MNFKDQIFKIPLISKALIGYSNGRTALYALESFPVRLINQLSQIGKKNKIFIPSAQQRKLANESLKDLYKKDIENIKNGIYPIDVLKPDSPQKHLRNFVKVVEDSLFTSLRRRKKDHKSFSKNAKKYMNSLPEYYQRNFHFQTDGYLSSDSAEIYDHQVEILFSGSTNAMRRILLKPLVEHLKSKGIKSPKILEVGCGTGSATEQILSALPDAEVTCLDLSYPYLKKAQKKLQNHSKTSFVQGLGESLNFKASSFDVVFSVYLFHELPLEIRKKVISEQIRVLKKGGFFALVDSIQLHDNKDLNWALEHFPKDFHEPFYTNYIKTPIENILRSNKSLSKAQKDLGFFSKVLWSTKS